MYGGKTGKGDLRASGGSGPAGFRYPSDDEAHRTLSDSYDLGIRYFDTAPWYGRGQSEHRVGRFLYDQEPRDEIILSTKVGRLLVKPKQIAGRGLSALETARPPVYPTLAGWANGQMGGTDAGLRFDQEFDYSYDGISKRCAPNSLP